MSKYIYGIHDIEGAHLMNGKGWVVATEEVGADPNNHNGADYTQSAKGATVICRLNYSYGNGTIPTPDKYADFAQRCANFAKNTEGCFLYIIGNEPNLSVEQPPGQTIQPEQYAECFSMCRHLMQLESSVLVGTAGIGPWNEETGDWIDYFIRMLSMANILGDVDFIALHTYTHGADPELVFSQQKMDAPYQDRYYHFYAYLDFMDAIPVDLRTVPVFITETNQNDAWADTNSGWVQNAYAEINSWNAWHTNRKISCLALYRYPSYDKYNIVGKQGVIDDLIASQQYEYMWTTKDPGGEMTEIFRDGFEGEFYYADDPYEPDQNVSELECPIGWTPDWVESTSAGINHRPEYKPKRKPQPEVYEGQQAVGIHTTTSSHDGVLYQRFSVTPGAKIKASVFAMGKGDGSGHGMSIAIDPAGGTDFKTLDGNYWGAWWGTDNDDWVNGEWKNISKEIVANSGTITVYLRTVARYANSNAAHFDNFLLESDKDGPLPPDPPDPPDPPTNGGIQAHIDAMQAVLDSLQRLVDTDGIRSLPI